jgi:hypothetical protein
MRSPLGFLIGAESEVTLQAVCAVIVPSGAIASRIREPAIYHESEFSAVQRIDAAGAACN